MNSVQNITSNSAPFMALPNITNYENIIINYNIKNKKKLLKVFKRKKKIKENYDLKKISVISVLFLL
jgi:hypothetical protein